MMREILSNSPENPGKKSPVLLFSTQKTGREDRYPSVPPWRETEKELTIAKQFLLIYSARIACATEYIKAFYTSAEEQPSDPDNFTANRTDKKHKKILISEHVASLIEVYRAFETDGQTLDDSPEKHEFIRQYKLMRPGLERKKDLIYFLAAHAQNLTPKEQLKQQKKTLREAYTLYSKLPPDFYLDQATQLLPESKLNGVKRAVITNSSWAATLASNIVAFCLVDAAANAAGFAVAESGVFENMDLRLSTVAAAGLYLGWVTAALYNVNTANGELLAEKGVSGSFLSKIWFEIAKKLKLREREQMFASKAGYLMQDLFIDVIGFAADLGAHMSLKEILISLATINAIAAGYEGFAVLSTKGILKAGNKKNQSLIQEDSKIDSPANKKRWNANFLYPNNQHPVQLYPYMTEQNS